MRRRERGREKNFEISFQQQKKKEKHAPSIRELDPSPRSRSRPRTRASVALPPRPFFYYVLPLLCLSVFLCFSLSEEEEEEENSSFFFLGENSREKSGKNTPDKRTKKTKKFCFDLGFRVYLSLSLRYFHSYLLLKNLFSITSKRATRSHELRDR